MTRERRPARVLYLPRPLARRIGGNLRALACAALALILLFALVSVIAAALTWIDW